MRCVLTSLGVAGHTRCLKVAALATEGAKAVAAVMAAVAHERRQPERERRAAVCALRLTVIRTSDNRVTAVGGR